MVRFLHRVHGMASAPSTQLILIIHASIWRLLHDGSKTCVYVDAARIGATKVSIRG